MKEPTYGSQTYGGITFSGLLGIIFIVLKLLDKIEWSWVWVLAPFWIPPAIVLILFVAILAVTYIRDLRS